MASNHKHKQWKQCARKMKYATLEKAKLAARRMMVMYGEKLGTYSCPYCNEFHIGHRKE